MLTALQLRADWATEQALWNEEEHEWWFNPRSFRWMTTDAPRKKEDAQAVLAGDAKLLPLVEALHAAGFRPALRFHKVLVHRWPGTPELLSWELERDGDTLDIAGVNRWLWLAAERPPWSPGEHRRFPPAFGAATRALLLAAHRGSKLPAEESASPLAGLGALPAEVLVHILEQAAYPLSAWAELDAGGPIKTAGSGAG
ncbi:hypothetical protein ABPG75_007266 [Micractinium tetrahymenae]